MMGGFPIWRFLGLAGLAIAIGALFGLAADRFHQKAKADAAVACDKAASAADKPIDACLPKVRQAIEAQRRAEACDHALGAPDLIKSRAAIRLVCSAEVKREFLARELAQGELAQANETIAALIDAQDLAVLRAETRAATANQKAQAHAQTIARAPRDAGSLIRCDASCLRDLAD
ncbi:hypothetical protein C7451_10172 [Blastomonas natatoria]|uniref:Uncharacterized protein n=1 Tax=Blastomonas natatoria TaxID=34015 RepID=A0A2V3VBQ4_9SPHN|nr:hypothetical protein [Blastomonas natatoria]PXW79010.1 hypothetical protein C7451_10172 [Blastomonas natatoria]